jgi:hypothetical protein
VTRAIGHSVFTLLAALWVAGLASAFFIVNGDRQASLHLREATQTRKGICRVLDDSLRSYPDLRRIGIADENNSSVYRLGEYRGWTHQQTKDILKHLGTLPEDRAEPLLRQWNHSCLTSDISLWLP